MIDAPVHFPRSQWVGYLLKTCFVHARQAFNDRLNELGLSVRAYHALYLARSFNGRLNQNAIAYEIAVTQNTASEIIKELAERKLLKQVPNPLNRRENLIAITEDGARLFALAEAVAAITQAQLLSVLTEPEQGELIRLLQKFAAGLNGIKQGES